MGREKVQKFVGVFMYKFQSIEEERNYAIFYANMLEDYFKNTSRSAFDAFVDQNEQRELFKSIKCSGFGEDHPLFQCFIKDLDL